MIDTPPPLSDAERRAQQWHDEHHRDQVVDGACWCCCVLCDPDFGEDEQTNPHYREADQQMRNA